MLAKRYELHEQIGAGGMATVTRATDTRLGRPVAIKRLHPHLSADPAALARFSHEMTLAASLSHPHIAGVRDVGYDGGDPFLVMDLVEGESLSDLLRRERRIDPRRVARIGADIAAALAHAHARGIVHRDIKPGNVLLDRFGRALLTDFGIATSEDTVERFTHDGSFIGTVDYMAPERAFGDRGTAASDLYSLGAVLYQLVTGRPPFSARDPLAVALAHRVDPVVAPSQLVDLPPALETVILALLEKDPRVRFASAGAVAETLDAISRGESPAIDSATPPTAVVAFPVRRWFERLTRARPSFAGAAGYMAFASLTTYVATVVFVV